MRLKWCHLVFDNKMIRFPLLYEHNPDIWGEFWSETAALEKLPGLVTDTGAPLTKN